MNKWAKELNREFSKEEVQMAKTHEKMLNISSHKAFELRTMLRFHLTPIRMVIIKNTNNNIWQGCGEKGTLMHC
jgi:hypothetical protein